VFLSVSNSLHLYCNNNGVIAQTKKPRSHQQSKHILWHYYLIHEIVNRGDVKICKVHMDLNDVGPLITPLLLPKHETHKSVSVLGTCMIEFSLNV
jgi:hypothetical protein